MRAPVARRRFLQFLPFASSAFAAVPKVKITRIRAIFTGFVYVKVETDSGVFGVGDGSCSDRDHAVIETIHKHFAPALLGRDPTRIEFIWQDVFRGNFWVAGPVMQSALSGIDMALWDIFGKLTGLPVYRLLGGAARDKVLVYVHIYGKTPEDLAGVARSAVAKGFRVLRMSPPGGRIFEFPRILRESVRQVQAVREAVGDDIEIAFDAHTRFTPQQGIELCERLAPYRPYFVEDPIRAEDMSLYRLLRSHTRAPLAAGEQLNHMWEFKPLIEENLVDFLRVDQSHAGGISHARKIAAMAEAHHQELIVHYTSSPVNSAANFHLNMAIPNCACQEYSVPGQAMLEISPNAFLARDGCLAPNDAPGLGLEFNETAALALERRLIDKPSSQLLNLRRPDGSVNNW
ncbi:MAG: mandelate racemase/muconate lactonizing enzyme family protein [Bryobacterales bacterium]|nr:mandelate racemase/muconate lactonizing enzyme family protein [Bryobacterales bacterium]